MSRIRYTAGVLAGTTSPDLPKVETRRISPPRGSRIRWTHPKSSSHAPPPPMIRFLPSFLTLSLALLASAQANAQDPKKKKPVPLGDAQGTAVREQMWRPPLDEEWKKPVLIKFQRSWKDAVQVSKETGKPILICVNMDGEIASEHYAGVRYRTPETARIYEPYVCVIASVYRHNARDYDEKGCRILCPRFGSVTCSEHIWIEPLLFGKYFDKERVAPRHIMIEIDGKETYDMYYVNDTRGVFDTIQRGIIDRRKELARQVRQRPERSTLDKVESRDVHDRDAVEEAYLRGDRDLKTKLLQRALVHHKSDPIDMLRLSIYDLDTELNKIGRLALMKSNLKGSIDLINEALRVPMDQKERLGLIAALERLGAQFPRAKKLAVVHKGLANRSKTVDDEGWAKALAGVKVPKKVEWSALESQLDYKTAAIKNRPKDANAHVELAEASLALAIDPKTTLILAQSFKSGSKYQRLMLYDAQRSAQEAEKLGANDWRVNSVLSISAYYLGETKEAHRRAELAVPGLPKGEQAWNAMGVLGIFAEARMAQIRRAERAKKTWPGQWLTDVHAAFGVLSKHPLGTSTQVVAHYDFLRGLAAHGQASRILDAGLKRFPDSALLHDRLRGRTLSKSGPKGLEAVYSSMLAKESVPKNLHWFAGYASIVAAEFYRRAGETEKALAAYSHAIAQYDTAIGKNPDSKHTSDHFAALAINGRARMALEKNDLEAALNLLIESFERKPESGGSLDGLSQTPMDTAKLLKSKLQQQEKTDLIAKLDGALAKLPPIAFELPTYEKNVGGPRNLVLRRGKLRRRSWRDRAEDRERRGLEEAKRRQKERLERERKKKEQESADRAKRGK